MTAAVTSWGLISGRRGAPISGGTAVNGFRAIRLQGIILLSGFPFPRGRRDGPLRSFRRFDFISHVGRSWVSFLSAADSADVPAFTCRGSAVNTFGPGNCERS